VSDGSVTDAVDLGDVDTFTFSAAYGEGVQLSLANLIPDVSLQPQIDVYDDRGLLAQAFRDSRGRCRSPRTAAELTQS
jgi:hypothetical protein